VNNNNKIVWSGTGDYKHGGIYEAGSLDSANIAKEVVNLAFEERWAIRKSKDPDTTEEAKTETVETESVKIEDTVEKTESALDIQQETPTVSLDSKETIMKAQERLNELGLNTGQADGIMGKKTTSAIEQYQKIRGLRITGQLNQETVSSLGIK
jgi:localization factor PodJL